MILIADREGELFSPSEERLHSRLRNANRIHFNQYGHDELVAILRDRAHWGLAENVITASGLQQITERAAGDARVAIKILRKTARTTNQNGQSRVHSSMVADVVLEAKLEIERETINRLTPHQKTLHNIINEVQEINQYTVFITSRDNMLPLDALKFTYRCSKQWDIEIEFKMIQPSIASKDD